MTCLHALLLVVICGQAPRADFPHEILKRGTLTLDVALPHAEKGYYRGTRFDWSGMVRSVSFDGHTFVDAWKDSHDPTNHDDCTGPAEEFGMDDPLGFAEARPGEAFVKIGVGVLRRPDASDYGFFKRYEIVEPGAWDVRKEEHSLTFRQTLKGPRGWAYEYAKTLALTDDSTFTIAHELKNTGTKPIKTTHYAHNFLHIDGRTVGPAYRLTVPFAIEEPSSPWPPLAEVRGNAITFREPIPLGSDVALKVSGPRPAEDNVVTVRNRAGGASVRIAGDRPLAKLSVWSVATATCPEPFVAIEVAPGETFRWTNTYTFSIARPQE